MRAMILAAGRGERLRPITDTIPKPLVKVGDKELLVWHLEKLKKAKISEIIINSAYLSEKIVSFIGDGSKFGLKVTHSIEGEKGLETAGGIIKALPFFENETFLVVNGDTFMDADYSQFIESLDDSISAKLYLVENPPHNQKGDFSLDENGNCKRGPGYTFSGAALYNPKSFLGLQVQRMPLLPLFEKWAQSNSLKAKLFNGKWFDVGTIERLNSVNSYIQNNNL
jgi:N-acetyl-alpha-D-muramate 1-phosphate uridylyltransferase